MDRTTLWRFHRPVRAVLALAWWASMLGIRPVNADERQEREGCFDAHERGQALRQEGKVAEAREAFRRCARDACPAMVRADCQPWSEELSRASVVVRARDAAGQAVPVVKLTVDAARVTNPADELVLVPGEHRIRVEVADGRTADLDVRVEGGERGRVVEAVFQFAQSKGTVAPAPRAEQPADATTTSPVAYVAAVVSVAALGSGAYFGLAGKSKERDLLEGCAPRCSRSQVDAMRRDYLAANVSFGVSAAAVAVAAWFFLHPTPSQPVAAAPLPGGAMLWTTGVF